jgi:hypothetical protein
MAAEEMTEKGGCLPEENSQEVSLVNAAPLIRAVVGLAPASP